MFESLPVGSDSDATPVFRVDANTPFGELGLDSLDIVEMLVEVERKFNIELTDQEYATVKNVEDIIAKIHGHPNAC